MMKNVVLLTAKGSNFTLPNKNLIKIGGKPCFIWSIEAAKSAKSVSDIFVSTDSKEIADLAREQDCKVIDRPNHLAMPFTNHGDVILHGLECIKQLGLIGSNDCLTVLLGNTVMTDALDIDECYDVLRDDQSASAALTMWKAQDDHPVRALSMDDQGYLKSYLNVSPDTNRQSYTEAFFYDQGPWVARVSTIESSSRETSGCGPWWWMGEKCVGVERPWVTGRDTHSMFDVRFSEFYLSLSETERKRFD